MLKPLDRNADISLEDAKKRLADCQNVFDTVKDKYEGRRYFLGRKRIRDDDHKALAEAAGVLLPLLHQPSVHKELGESADRASTVVMKAQELLYTIGAFLSEFKNTGVRLVMESVVE